jgi:lysophospholipase L1-like esterase
MAETTPLIKPQSVILFQGDSITDAGRSRTAVGPNSPDDMGYGYPRLIMDSFLEQYPDHDLQFYNRGLSGDRIRDLEYRWQSDTVTIQPSILSILIGINDTWNYVLSGLGTSPEEYWKVYRKLLANTMEASPFTRFVLCEPFLLITGDVTDEWLTDNKQRRNIVRSLAEDFNAVFVPFQAALNYAALDIPAHHLLDDGMHPTPKGHQVLADCWIKAVLEK